MIKYTWVALPAILLMAAQPYSRTPHSARTPHSEWRSIFDGKTTKGWHSYGQKKAGAQWEVKDGALHLEKSKGGGGDLLTDAVYSNFDLKLEWKISPKG